MRRPDASLHNPDPAYLRELIARAGLTQHGAAEQIGIKSRAMRYYLTDPASGNRFLVAPYPVQYALEGLALEGDE